MRNERFYLPVFAGVFLILFGLALMAVMEAQMPPDPSRGTSTLHISHDAVADLCMVTFTLYPPMPEGTGGGQLTTNLYTGLAWTIRGEGLPEAGMKIECSTDLTNWFPFPKAGFQLVLFSSNRVSIVIPPDGSQQMFFRASGL